MAQGATVQDQGDTNVQELVVVTGPAGAGRTTAIRSLEDFGFEAIDNLPLSFLPRLVLGAPPGRPMAVGIDPRTRDFTPDRVVQMLADLAVDGMVHPTLLYVDCNPDRLLRRFSETRRRHPMAPDDSPRDGIIREQTLLEPLLARADVLIDTSDLSPHELRSELAGLFSQVSANDLTILVQSFSYKRGVPRGADMVIDLRFLRNPHWEPELRPKDGRDAPVAAYIRQDEKYAPFFLRLMEFTTSLLPAYKAEGKSYFTIGMGCTGGQHRSVFVTEALAKGLAENGWRVSIRHRELESRGKLTPVTQG